MSSYRDLFLSTQSASSYDDKIYASGSTDSILWSVEAAILTDLVQEFRKMNRRIDYLDFACGTGRILAHLENAVDSATGIDVSSEMLQRATRKVTNAKLCRTDITSPDKEIEARYDLITAFRFLTNAEPDLRAAALRALALRLKSEKSLLIVNTHSNPWSYRLLFLPYHWLKDRFLGRRFYGYLSNRQARAALRRAGLTVERVIGMGFVPQKMHPFVPNRVIIWVESHFARKPFIQALGVNQIFLCRRIDVQQNADHD